MIEYITFQAPWITYAIGQNIINGIGNIALGSFIDKGKNEVIILQVRGENIKYELKFEQLYPSTKLGWHSGDLLLSCAHYLCVYKYEAEEHKISKQIEFLPNAADYFKGPQVAFDYHENTKQKIVTCSVDSSISVYDLNHNKLMTQVKAHDKDVNDISFSNDVNTFATVSHDGTCKMFDIRDLHTNTSIYENEAKEPLFNVAFDCHEGTYIAFSDVSGENIYIHDLRKPSNEVFLLKGHEEFITQLSWYPTIRHRLFSTSDDQQALSWSLQSNKTDFKPIFNVGLEINNFSFSQDYLGLTLNQTYALLPPEILN